MNRSILKKAKFYEGYFYCFSSGPVVYIPAGVTVYRVRDEGGTVPASPVDTRMA